MQSQYPAYNYQTSVGTNVYSENDQILQGITSNYAQVDDKITTSYNNVGNRQYGQINFQSIGVQGLNSNEELANTTVTLGNSVQVGFVVVSKEEIEFPWREECEYLQNIIEDLQNSKGNAIRELELSQENQSLQNQLKIQQSESQKYQIQSKEFQHQLELLKQKYNQLSEEQSQTQTTEVSYLSNEVNVWKQKFIEVNHEFNDSEEKLIMCQAELDSLKQQSQKREVTVTTKTVKTGSSTTSGSQVIQDNTKESSSRIH